MAFSQLYNAAFVATNISNFSGHANHTPFRSYAEWGNSAVNRSLVGIMCSLSILGSITIMISFASWVDVRTTSRKILLFLSVSDFMIATSNLFGVLIPVNSNVDNPRNPLCLAQSFITTSSSIMSFLWTLTLAIYLYLAIVMNKQSLGKKLLPLFHVINWFLGPVINGIALSKDMLGYAADPITGGWCWIYHDSSLDTSTKYVISNKEKLWIVIDGKGIEIIVYTTIFIIYGSIKFKLHKELKHQSQMPMDPEVLKAAKSADQKLIFVPLLLFFGRCFGIIKFFIAMCTDIKPTQHLATHQKALFTLEGIGDSSQGFLNCILFCFLNPKVYSHLREAFLYYVCCRCCNASEPRTDSGSLNGDDCQPSLAIPEPSSESSKPLLDGGLRFNKYGSQWKRR